jgi:hypothetical protein
MKPKLKVPGTKRFKLYYDAPLSIFAFNFNLRRYTLVEMTPADDARVAAEVGRCRLTLSNPS